VRAITNVTRFDERRSYSNREKKLSKKTLSNFSSESICFCGVMRNSITFLPVNHQLVCHCVFSPNGLPSALAEVRHWAAGFSLLLIFLCVIVMTEFFCWNSVVCCWLLCRRELNRREHTKCLVNIQIGWFAWFPCAFASKVGSKYSELITQFLLLHLTLCKITYK